MSIKKQKPMRRGAGVLLPVFSLPSDYGIGTFGKEAYKFVDFLCAAGQKYWQVLPLGPTSYGDSPYQSFSAFSGNPYFIDLDMLVEDGLLTKKDITAYKWGDEPSQVDYALLYESRFKVLKKAFKDCGKGADFLAFCGENAFWLDDYSRYMAIKMYFGGKSWIEWPDDIRMAKTPAMEKYTQELKSEILFWKICQFYFQKQWSKLKEYANGKGIEIIGDIPIYVALDSSDVWMNHGMFQLDEKRNPTRVAGVPPDIFSADGQLWGNPLYDWDVMGKDGFAWWKKRMQHSARLYDVIRIDHFVGIAHYYSIPAGDKTAANGEWVHGPGAKLLEAIGSVMGDKRVIAEDLGNITKTVKRLIKITGYPGMKVLQFAFDGDAKNGNLPGYYEKNIVVYGGTHDNETLAGYFSHQKQKSLRFTREYLNVKRNREITGEIIRVGYASTANTAIFQLQDYMELDNTARINTPSTIGGNWLWRLDKDGITAELAAKINHMVEIYGR